ncbi:3-hydroxyacyl-CoA dehydrogenase NAD-binding domain-containing protein [Leptothrix discophora]|uniref:3-hydroxyacyl-CoA dehydrogenase NAD-binding domain-containing protein n=1 Tax=Leptothrix discophora TaxID=89 RepID=A0ABT9FZV6_LEPDI|nr:3-hydroxyacyl-CoA dehydrogenase NAD-binding domain-containing protein [Leptothrix discophora]MDP4299582.1 3-hydroxyacyl-CoA dehydrogenase NAD-binding domain-containing protein [Leptothrix discophora]
MTATLTTRGRIAVITLDHPPVNGLSLATRRAVAAAIDAAEDDAGIDAIVLTGHAQVFCAGADITEFGSPKAITEPHLISLITRFENCSKPVVAAIGGTCMGGGLELALGCHYRVAGRGVKVALPEVKIGLVPGAGGTQRLPRALGVEPALNMIISGEPVAAERLAQLPGQRLLDAIVDPAEVLDTAVALATERAGLRPLPRVRDLKATHPSPDAYFRFVRNSVAAMSRNVPAPVKCVDCVEQAVKSRIDDGLTFERETYLALMVTPESRALRHAFLAERAAGKVADLPAGTPPRPVERVGVVGAGTMGTGIALNFLAAGLPVVLVEQSQAALDKGVAALRGVLEGQLKKGKLKPEALEARLALLRPTLDWAALADADLIVEAVFEDLAVKQQVFERLDGIAKVGAILASNTSTLDVDRIAAFTRRPQDVLGLHFFSPAHVMKLLEVVRGQATAPEVLLGALAVGKRIRKTCVVSGVCDGFIGNRMVEHYFRQAGFLLDEGASPQQVDRAMEKFGFAMGPFKVSDLAGNDIGWAIRQRRAVERPELRYSMLADTLCEAGRFGQKTGAGWYDHVAGSKPGRLEALPSPVVAQMIEAHRQKQGITPRRIPDDEIVGRLVGALVNEGARLLEEGIAARASDIDIVYLTGYGFPAWRGGPMCWADTQGLFNVVQAMKRYARNPHDDATFWQPAPLLRRLANDGRTFN